jgi:uncharacterized protein (TIGR02145 family)
MMKNIKKHLLLIATIVVITVSCSKDDSPNEPVNGGEIFTAQIVTVNLPDADFDANEYQGTIGGIPVTLTVSPDNTLLFMAPIGLEGNHDLVIPALDLTFHYNLTATVLDKTPDETIEDLTANFSTFIQLIDESPEAASVKHNIETFNTYFSNANIEEKTNIAIAYKANKALIDDLLLNNNSASRGIVGETLFFIAKHKQAVVLMLAGAALISATPILGVAIAGAGAYKAYKANAEAIDNIYNTITLKVGTWFGSNNRGPNDNGLVLLDNQPKTIPFDLVERRLIASDADKTEPIAKDYFTSHNLYNYYAEKTNDIIDNTNTVKGTDFSDLTLEELPQTTPEVNNPVNEEMFSKVQFTINHPNVSLVSAILDGDGQLKITVKIVGTPVSYPVLTSLNYSYDDDFSSFTGTLPIEVTNLICETITDFDGNTYNVVPIGEQCWTAHNLNVSHYRNGDPIPQIENETEWLNATYGAWCYFANNTENGIVYGKLYNWYAVNDARGLAPEGYHIPNQDEWREMVGFLGGYVIAGGKLKSTEYWQAPNVGATNETGFTGVPGSQRNGAFYNDGWGVVATYWSSSINEDNPEKAWSNTLSRSSAACSEYQGSWVRVGMSVRCVKD